jgi:hypothetical protein
MNTMNIYFTKNKQTRFVRHGFSWQIFCFGPLVFVMRNQPVLAALCFAVTYGLYMAVGSLTLLLFDPGMAFAHLVGFIAGCTAVGCGGNRFSARAYVKNGWVPVADFPADWNVPPLVAKPSPTPSIPSIS